MLYAMILILAVLDQIIKYVITNQVALSESIPVISGFFSITYVKNSGGAFSFLAEKSWGIFVLAGISVIVSILLLIALYRLRAKNVPWIRFALALLVAGTIGNMIDRIRTRYVVDYLMFQFGTYTFPVFNLADMCIVCGSILLAVLLLFDKKLFRPADAEKKEAKISGDSSGNED
jgi:signal peptidase II